MRVYLYFITLCILITMLFSIINCKNRGIIYVFRGNDTIFVDVPKLIDEDKLFDAFAYVESRNNPEAINPETKASGIVQIMPVLIKEANRISGFEKYSLNDRFSIEKSKEIFHLIMEHKNPSYDIHLACKIWNPFSRLSYHVAIEEKYNELINKK